ncbi:hypothetical protein ONZ45_g5458 [Pleurotus djamor]|nr:hypothetical protein ONZ45_g5458 [Pleurotus djamor]
MSISIDDLVSSLSSSHIGQEALDLAALQAQLAQSLAQAIQQSANGQARRETRPHACNTPTAHTPSASFTFAEAQRYYDSMTARRNSQVDDFPIPMEQMDEDERMVEDLLLPQTPMSANGTTSFEQHQHYLPNTPHSHHFKGYTSPFATDAYPNSTFASTDPFYQQAVQKSIGFNASPTSVFTQTGRPSHHSPFLTAQKQK